jgi:hypothetical protein
LHVGERGALGDTQTGHVQGAFAVDIGRRLGVGSVGYVFERREVVKRVKIGEWGDLIVK